MKNIADLVNKISFKNLLYSTKDGSVENIEWAEINYGNFIKNIKYLSFGLKKSLSLSKGERFAIMASYNSDWLMVDLAIMASGLASVPLFYNISTETLKLQLEDSDAKYIFVENQEYLNLVIKTEWNFEKIIVGYDELKKFIEFGETYLDRSYFGRESDIVNSEDLATIVYTSGTGGNPKGVLLSHQNIIHQMEAISEKYPLQPEDVFLSWLPLSHVFGRIVLYYCFYNRITIYFADTHLNLVNIMKNTNPTLMASVPRFLEKIYKTICEKTQDEKGLKKIVAKLALSRASVKNFGYDANLAIDRLFDRLIYSKFRQIFGNRMKMIISGGAGVNINIEKFFRNIGVNLYVGYGLTESSPVIATNCPQFNKIGTIGKALDKVEVKIAENGELLAKGPNIMLGYNNMPEETKKAIRNGWLHTGDKAEIDEEGYIKIIGRIKELYKTSYGKYVNPVKIEMEINKNPFVLDSVIVADGRNFTSAVIFIDFSKEIHDLNRAKIDINNHVSKVNSRLDNWEKIKKFYISEEKISILSGHLTPSLKIKRKFVMEKYSKIIEEFYKN